MIKEIELDEVTMIATVNKEPIPDKLTRTYEQPQRQSNDSKPLSTTGRSVGSVGGKESPEY